MIEKDTHIENVYAFDENFKEIYIGDVPKSENGIKKNYFCLGCKRQMLAVKGDIRKQHFKHHVKPNSTESKCTYGDETHRHLLAKANAFDLKRIKVPAVYKYPPNKEEDKVLLIKDAEFIEAHTVLNEHYVYENEQGEIQVSATFNGNEDNYLFIKPDSLFLDKEGKPILIIEFVATHKPDQDKLMKLKRLGIDAIQVNVPKSSPEEIRDLFFNTKRTKWLYNHEENETDYLQLSDTYSGGIFEIDNEQRRLFEEGYKCRKAQLGDFIRTIGRLLESEHYREVEQNLESEIRRVEANSEREATGLEDLRANYIESGIKQHHSRREELEKSSRNFQEESRDLEERYTRKKRELAIAEREIENEYSTNENQEGGNKHSGNSIGESIDKTKESIRNLEGRIEFDRREKEKEIRGVDKAIEQEKRGVENLPIQFEKNRESLEHSIRSKIEAVNRDVISIEGNKLEESRNFDRDRKRIEEEFARETKRINEKDKNGDINGNDWYSREISLLDSFRKSLNMYKKIEELLTRAEQKERDYSKKN